MNRFLSAFDLVERSRSQQPGGQGRLAHRRLRGIQELEERAGTKEIQILCIEVVWSTEPASGFTKAGPSVFQAGQSMLVPCDHVGHLVVREEYTVVADYQPREDRDGKAEPPDGHVLERNSGDE